MGDVSVITTIFTIISWISILVIAYFVYKKLQEKPAFWRVLVVTFIGIFAFTINLEVFDSWIRLPILPLGVWILMVVFIGKEKRWEIYRPFAWIGFAGQFIFLFTSLLTIPLNHLVYPEDQLSTYIANADHSSVISTHPSAEKFSFDKNEFVEQLKDLKRETIYSDKWYEEVTISMTPDGEAVDERFPYFLTGIDSKWGSGVSSAIYIENDGRGLLITTPESQYYFRSDELLLKVEDQ
ncbi:hypothetical protein FPQ10_01250 [Allobacillus sp. SKP2-8]|uniref:hypothetical protein n=1 Tax=unclassified Allobacillus TaxID=2628859 RepID=UPI0011842B23|nr:hypothetical protein [Allobacillus sp. SKP2-8]TSJ69102.1 hypothetical protein FPQ10_01250 [Allobacillus sp. SKP2-8]